MPDAVSSMPEADSASSRPKFFTEKMVKWAIFSVAMALVPLAASTLSQATRGPLPSIDQLVARGELLLITAALCARSCGELFGSSDVQRVPKLFAGGATVVVMLLAAIYFSDIAASYRAAAVLDAKVIGNTSLVLYVSSVIAGAGCVFLSEAKT